MKVLVLSDIHGNLPALEYLLSIEKDCELIISLGDVVNYGPWSNECVALLDNLPSKILIKGNHEEAFIKGIYNGKNVVAQTFFNVCFSSFNSAVCINNYLNYYEYLNNSFIHTINDSYIFSDTEINIDKNYFIGHSHRMFLKMNNNFRLVNVGSVGQNRVNIDEINYVIWDTESNNIKLMNKHFSADLLINEMKSRNYPQICIDYILSKKK